MKIRHISIKNFRGIKELEAPFPSDFICLIGPGDSCKSTLLTAIEYALYPKWNLQIEDSDFYNLDTDNNIVIEITLIGWNEEIEQQKDFLSEAKFGQYKRGYKNGKINDEPYDIDETAITINLTIDNNYEPIWIIKRSEDDVKKINYKERFKVFSVGKIDSNLDNNFSFSKTSILTKILSEDSKDIVKFLKRIASKFNDKDFSFDNAEVLFNRLESMSSQNGFPLNNIKTKFDKLTIATNFLALYNDNLPFRCYGTGTKKILSFSLQKIYKEAYNILLFDEIETGLEPNRIRGLLKGLHEEGKQIFLTTHSPVVLRELKVENKELYKCTIEDNGKMNICPIEGIPNQKQIRTNAESFLSKKIILCEGRTEIGIVRALEEIKIDVGEIPLWSLSTMYYDAGGDSKLKERAMNLLKLKYSISVLCDYDNTSIVDDLKSISGLEVFTWDKGKCTEEQLIDGLEFNDVLELVKTINIVRVSEDDSEIDYIRHINILLEKEYKCLSDLDDNADTRKCISNIMKGIKKKDHPHNYDISSSFKNISYSEKVFKNFIPKLKEDSTMKIKLNELWEWTQQT